MFFCDFVHHACYIINLLFTWRNIFFYAHSVLLILLFIFRIWSLQQKATSTLQESHQRTVVHRPAPSQLQGPTHLSQYQYYARTVYAQHVLSALIVPNKSTYVSTAAMCTLVPKSFKATHTLSINPNSLCPHQVSPQVSRKK